MFSIQSVFYPCASLFCFSIFYSVGISSLCWSCLFFYFTPVLDLFIYIFIQINITFQQKQKMASSRLQKQPKFNEYIPTLNNRGYQMSKTSPLLKEWIRSFDGRNPLVDLGCAYGINTYEALDANIPVIALDMYRRHLQILEENAPPSKSKLLSCVLGELPYDIPIADISVSGVLVSEVFHFLTGEEINKALSTLMQKLVPGGSLFITTMSIHFFDDIDKTIVHDFYAKRNNDVEWPGFCTVYSWCYV